MDGLLELDEKIIPLNYWNKNILDEKDDRVIVAVGPCSIHDPVAAIEYAKKLKKVPNDISNNLLIIMTVYVEKPRTTIG